MSEPTIKTTSWDALKLRIGRLQQAANIAKAQAEVAARMHTLLVRQGFTPTQIETALSYEMDNSLNEMIDRLIDMCNVMPVHFNREIWSGIFPRVEADLIIGATQLSFDIDVDNGSSKAEITSNFSGWFDTFDVADQITIVGSEDQLHDGNYVVDARTSTVLTLTTVMAGSDNAADTQMRIRISRRG